MFCLHVCLCTMCVSGAHGGQRGCWVPQELELKTAVSRHVGAENWTWVLQKGNQCSNHWAASPALNLQFKRQRVRGWMGEQNWACDQARTGTLDFRGMMCSRQGAHHGNCRESSVVVLSFCIVAINLCSWGSSGSGVDAGPDSVAQTSGWPRIRNPQTLTALDRDRSPRVFLTGSALNITYRAFFPSRNMRHSHCRKSGKDMQVEWRKSYL